MLRSNGDPSRWTKIDGSYMWMRWLDLTPDSLGHFITGLPRQTADSQFRSVGIAVPRGAISTYPDGRMMVGTRYGMSSSGAVLGLPKTNIVGTALAASGEIFVSTSSDGIFHSTDWGATSRGLNAGLPTRNVGLIAIEPGGNLFLCTESNGWYRSIAAFSGVAPKTAVSDSAGVRLFPNPTKSICTIVSNGPIFGIKVIDCVGRIVMVHSQQYGRSTSQLDLHALPSGTYLVVVQSGGVEKSIRVEVEH